MNTVAKGSRIERKAEEMLKKQGHLTYRAKRTKFNSIDIFGFDIIAMSADSIKLVQTKSSVVTKKVLQTLLEIKCPPCVSKEVWLHEDRKGFTKIYFLTGDTIIKRDFNETQGY